MYDLLYITPIMGGWVPMTEIIISALL